MQKHKIKSVQTSFKLAVSKWIKGETKQNKNPQQNQKQLSKHLEVLGHNQNVESYEEEALNKILSCNSA